MDRPDKIYLAFKNGFIAQSSNVKEDANGNSIFLKEHKPIEYISKDALLEWAKERKKQMKIEAGGCWNMHATGEYMAIDKLIKKLESM